MEKKTFVLYNYYGQHIKKLSDEQCGKLMKAVFEYVSSGKTDIELNEAGEMLFGIITERLDYDAEKYAEKCLINSINGKKGGRPKKSNKTERFFEKPEKAYTDTESDTDTDTESDTESDTDTETHTLTECEYNKKHTLGEENKNQTSVLEKEKHRGNYGFVALTDEALSRLKEKYGEKEVFRLIEYLDESAASTGNKNGWKNWELVIERAIKGGWGRNRQNGDNDKKVPMALNYPQKRYTDADLANMGIEFDIIG